MNQFTVVEGQNNRRPDVLIFLNGLPIVLMELKNPADENATIWNAFDQIQTYKAQIPSLFTYNEVLIISDGLEARVGSLTASTEWFMPWRTIEGEALAPASLPQLQVVLQGLLDKRRLLDFIRYFVVFEDEGGGILTKKIAGYHQFHAVNRALAETLKARATLHLSKTKKLFGYRSPTSTLGASNRDDCVDARNSTNAADADWFADGRSAFSVSGWRGVFIGAALCLLPTRSGVPRSTHPDQSADSESASRRP